MPLRIVWTNGSQYDLTYQSLSSLINCKSGRGHLVVLLTILGIGHYVFRCVFVFCCVIYLQQFCMPFPFGIWTFLQSYFCFVLDLQCLVKADHWEIWAFQQEIRKKVNRSSLRNCRYILTYWDGLSRMSCDLLKCL